jgi:phospholipid/cholesterol/gamma-HCH transport system substrate-binding protein
MTATSALRRHRHELYGALTLVALAAIIALVIAAYLQAFTPFVVATVHTDRSGLLLARDSDVTMRDVRVGKVGRIEPDGPHGASVQIDIDPDQTEFIPANSSADIVAPTLFGPKYVQLNTPAHPTQRRIATGDVITPTQVQVEANTAFENLMGLLQSIHPAELDSALGALSTSLQGRGQELGDYLGDLDRYLGQINGATPALRADLASAPGVIDTYADASPDLVRILGNLTVTSNTVVHEKPTLDALIVSFTRFSGTAQSLLEDNEKGLTSALAVLRPTTALLQRYSPMFPCLFHSANVLRTYTEPAFGGTLPGLHTETSFVPAAEPYTYPTNLPRLGVDAPGCYGGAPPPGVVPAHTSFPDGSPRLDSRKHPPTVGDTPLALYLFGQDLGSTIPLPGMTPAAHALAPVLPAVPGVTGGGR